MSTFAAMVPVPSSGSNAVALSENVGIPAHELNSLIGVVHENQDLIERVWHEYFGT
jgi:hypothetical protein